MPHALTDHLSPTPIHTPCAVRVGGHNFVFGAQFFAIATVPNGGVGGRPVAPVPCDRSSATNSNPVGSQPQDGAEGRSLSPALGANVSDHDILESYSRLQSVCRVAKELNLSVFRARKVLKAANVEMRKGAKRGTLHTDGMHFTVEPHGDDETAAILRHPLGDVIINVSDFHLVDGRRLNFKRSRADASTYVKIAMPTGEKYLSLSRAIMSCPDGYVVDHIDGNTFDNRRQNLRVCRPVENSRNRKKGRSTKSIFKGVTSSGDRWMSVIMVDRKQRNLGIFATEAEAAHAYDEAARMHHGDFAAVNFPMGAHERCAIAKINHAATANGKAVRHHA